MTGPAWMRSAACLDDVGLPWTADPAAVTRVQADRMSVVCSFCPVLGACSAYATATGVTAGYWAGAGRDTPDLPDRLLAPVTARPARSPRRGVRDTAKRSPAALHGVWWQPALWGAA